MIKNYFKIAWRNIWKSKAFSFINILGLSTGMATAIIIGLWINDGLNFNKNFENYDTVAQVIQNQTFNGEIQTSAAVPMPMGDALRTQYDYFENVGLTSWDYEHILWVGDNKFLSGGLFAEPQILEMLTPEFIDGSVQGFEKINSIIISDKLAESLFGTTKAAGKIIKYDNTSDLEVAAVFKAFPRSSDFYKTEHFVPFSFYIASQRWIQETKTEWGNNSFQCFVQLKEGVNFTQAERSTQNLIVENLPDQYKIWDSKLMLHPMEKWHLESEFKNGINTGGRILYVKLFGIIGIFILLLACINFMNLATARSEKRAKEVGIRKSIGSLRSQLAAQFFSESLLMAGLSGGFALAFVAVTLPSFNELADKAIQVPWANPVFIIGFVVFVLLVGLLSGVYPAFYLSSFEPLKVLKGTFKVGRNASLPRKVLVSLQFTISIVLIIGTIVIYKQIEHAQNRPIGYDKDRLITVAVNTPDLENVNYNTIREDLINTGSISEFCTVNTPMTSLFNTQVGFSWEGKSDNLDPLFGVIATTHDYVKTAGLTIKEGRGFSREFSTDSSACLLNEAAAELINIPDIVGKYIQWGGSKFKVIGIVQDVVMNSPYEQIKPNFYHINYYWAEHMLLRISPEVSVSQALNQVKPVFAKHDPGSPFSYEFVDEAYANKFKVEQRVGKLSLLFTALAILISCLGIFGLASFVAEQRTKEIGVRKVLGASIINVWQLLSFDFLKLVGIAFLIAAPLAYYFLNGWLENYVYRTNPSWWIFALAGVGTVLIVLITVSFQSVKAALLNPVDSLKND